MIWAFLQFGAHQRRAPRGWGKTCRIGTLSGCLAPWVKAQGQIGMLVARLNLGAKACLLRAGSDALTLPGNLHHLKKELSLPQS